MLIAGIVIATLVIFGYLFLNFNPQFGAKPDNQELKKLEVNLSM